MAASLFNLLALIAIRQLINNDEMAQTSFIKNFPNSDYSADPISLKEVPHSTRHPLVNIRAYHKTSKDTRRCDDQDLFLCPTAYAVISLSEKFMSAVKWEKTNCRNESS